MEMDGTGKSKRRIKQMLLQFTAAAYVVITLVVAAVGQYSDSLYLVQHLPVLWQLLIRNNT